MKSATQLLLSRILIVTLSLLLVITTTLWLNLRLNLRQKSIPRLVVIDSPPTTENIVQHLMDNAVMIEASNTIGSGILITKGGTSYILTCAHTLDDVRHIKHKNNEQLAWFDDVLVKPPIFRDYQQVGFYSLKAEIIGYSSRSEQDLALLQILKTNFFHSTTLFYHGNPPALGSELYHVGCLLGEQGVNSITSGILSQYGRDDENTLFDQTTCPVFPGSSGGGIFLKNGRCIGLVARHYGETYSLFIPIRRIQQWLKSIDMEYLVEDATTEEIACPPTK